MKPSSFSWTSAPPVERAARNARETSLVRLLLPLTVMNESIESLDGPQDVSTQTTPPTSFSKKPTAPPSPCESVAATDPSTKESIIMSQSKKAALSLAAALVTRKLGALASGFEINDILHPLGLSRRRSHTAGTLLALGAGVAVGGAVALLLAPCSGRETRARVAKKLSGQVEEVLKSVPEGLDSRGVRVDAMNDHAPS